MSIAANRALTVAVLGTTQTLSWASSYYLPAILATPIAAEFDLSRATIFGIFSLALLLTAVLGPAAGRAIDQRGGRDVLAVSNLVFAAGLVMMGLAPGPLVFGLAWAVMGVAMAMGLYDAAFATLAGLYGKEARNSITGITLIAGFASTVGWPASALMEAEWGWRGTCFGWAALQVLVGLPLNRLLLPPVPPPAKAAAAAEAAGGPEPRFADMALLAFVLAAAGFSASALGAHLPGLLQAAGATAAAAVAAGALLGPAQVGARILEFGLLRNINPMVSARIAVLAHPLAVAVLLAGGAPVAAVFVLIHGAGNGMLTITRGTLPLALFGPVGYGRRQGLITAPARATQAFAPYFFGLLVDAYGAGSLLLTAALGLAALAALFVLKARPA
ncbi:MFS transporter [Roseomonas terrae]|jgi:MFS family permease|uniref:MFS transporter n=1 Tax=Neoroseomonas terrae TaxID=424799 RepID=A0ABS5ENE6_9PROT|nr:MFS transporter [Neoroseomonas terrae]MBR0652554.1 MFS transporter [Neoroseomonas terrae]